MASYHFHSSPVPFASQTNNHRLTSSSEPSAFPHKQAQLGVEFKPCAYSVVCGGGLKTFNHVGNHRFRILARKFIERYSQADTRAAKSAIVSEIVALVCQAGGFFCKCKRGVWLEVGNRHAREKVGASLRNLLHSQYKSSTKARADRRRSDRKTVKQQQNQNQLSDQKRVDDTPLSDDSSTTSSCWGRSKDSLGFEYWLEENYFDIDVF
jgi:hypothetical protein